MSGRGKARRSLELIDAAYDILAEIQPASVRAVCYRLFIAGLIESMAKSETNKVSTQLTWARENSIVPWSWIVDETREVKQATAWENPGQYVEAVKRSYRRDRWTDQPDRIELWSEKATVGGTVAPVLDEFGIAFRVMHGYGSATAIYQAAQDSLASHKLLTVFYIGDYDPSGLHMSAVDLPRRIAQYGGDILLQRLALTNDDIITGIPSFPTETKRKDPRFGWYLAEGYGSRCWELDALSPVLLRDRVKQAILGRLDMDAWRRAEVTEAAEIESLTTILSAWPGISGRASKCEATDATGAES